MIRPRSRNHQLLLLAFLVLCGAVVWFLPSKDAPEEPLQSASSKTPRSERGELRGGDRARKVLADRKEADESALRISGALHAAQGIAARPTGQAEFDVFNGWVSRYLAAPEMERGAMLAEGVAFAEARRLVLADLIQTDPRRAIGNAVPPVVRQELPTAVVKLLEERVNEQAFFGVMGVVPAANAEGTPTYRREVRTDDGGVYRASTYGDRNSQRTTERASIVGIAVDDFLAVDERPLRIVESGEIPNHPNNLTRRRTVVPLDERGFVLGREVIDAPAPPHGVVETCPVSGKSTEAPVNGDGSAAAVTEEQVVVEAGGKFHVLCSGGHILVYEDGLIAGEGGNGGPIKPTSPPAATQGTGYKSHLLMRVAFPEALKGSVTEKEGHDLGKNVQDWFVDSSYGAMSFLTTVSPLIVLPRSEAWYKDQDTGGSAYEVLTDARVAAKLAGFDPANFDFDTVIYTGTPGGFGGQAYVGGKGCWLKSGTGTGVAAHEYGHNFGLWHSNFWSTTNGSVIGGGTEVEYGDSFDTMGSASAGDLQFNAYQKNLLNWIPNAGVHDVAASGTYRIYPMDQPAQDPRLRYAMKIRKDADRDYWVDLRQKFTSNAWVQGGVFLHWSPWAPSDNGPQLLDATPGSPDGKTDAPLVVGRTFSDPETGIHITPIAKNATTPVSMDVVVNIGTFPGNQAPTVGVGASATSVATNAAVNLTATASDLDGDVLSYAWEFGDNSFSTTNLPTVSKSWASAGVYRVRCTVSDMKGQTASSSVIITVGSPTTFTVAGTITAGGLPLQGVRVHNGRTGTGLREDYTGADGTYTIVGLAAGTYSVSPQLYGYTISPTSTSVTVGSSKTGVNFTATDLSLVSIALQDADCAEGTNTGTFRISRTGSTASALTVNCYAPSGTATKGTDYTFSPDTVAGGLFQTFTIPAGQAFLDVVVTALTNSTVESFETVTLELVPSTSYSLGSGFSTLLIADSNTTLPLVRMQVSDRDALESGDAGQFIIERLGSTAGALSVVVSISGTATNGTDYTTIPTTITIPDGASTAPVNVSPLQDTNVETMETFILTISTNAAYVRAASITDYSGTVNLHDDDAPTLTVVATDSTASEPGLDTGQFTITRTGSTAQALTVNYGLTGAALHGTDYLPLPGVLTIPAGSSSATVLITPINDNIGEPAQTVVFQLRSGLGYAVGATGNATVTINDDVDLPYASIAVTTGPAIEGGTAGVFRITTTGSGSGNITVQYAVSGTATNGSDYTLLSGTVSMGKNTTSNVTISPIQDALVEGYENIVLTLTPDPTYLLALDTSAMMNLQDDDAAQINVSGTDDAFSEANGSLAKFFISRTGATTNALTVNYTMGGTATSGADYTAPSGSVTIAAGATGAYVDISMLADTLAEGTETIILNVTPGASYAAGIGSATRYIADAQSASVATQVRFSAASSSAAENVGTVNIPVTLSAAAAGTVTVEYFINGGTALGGGADYRMASGVLTFAPGETAKSVPVEILGDTISESNETLVIALSNPGNSRLGTSSHTLTITNVDVTAPNTVVVTSPNGGETIYFGSTQTITWSANITGNVKIELFKAGSLHSVLSADEANDNSYLWSVSAGLPSGADYTVKISSVDNPAYSDLSNAAFSIIANPIPAAVDAPDLPWITSGDSPWFAQTTTTKDGIDAVQSGAINHSQSSTLETSVTGAGTLTFWWKVSSETNYDYLSVYLNGVLQTGANVRISGNVDWVQKSVTIPTGTNTVSWVYSKDDSVVSGSDAAWIDQVVFTPALSVEIAVEQPVGTGLTDGSASISCGSAIVGASSAPITFTVKNLGTADLTGLSISKDGTHNADFAVGSLGATTIAPGGSTTFAVTFSPGATGTRTAAIHIASNDADENPFDISLTGTGIAPGALAVTSASGLASSGVIGGPFSPTSVDYTLTNSGGAPINWTASKTQSWVTLGATSGTLAAGATTTVTVSINTAANSLSAGGYSDIVTFVNSTNGTGNTTRDVVLSVTGLSPILSQNFDGAVTGWVTTPEAGSNSWAITTTASQSPSSSYFAAGSSSTSITHLDSPSIAIPSNVTTLAIEFWHRYNLQQDRDCGKFYLSIDGGTWFEVTSIGSGVAFTQNGYNSTMASTGQTNPFPGEQGWSGTTTSAFVKTAINFTDIPKYAGKSLRLRWTLATNNQTASEGWYVDSVAVSSDVSTPGVMAVTPAGNFTPSGPAGGAFSPATQQYTIQNTGGTSINWTAAKTASWVTLSATSGALPAGGSTTITVSINSNADPLAIGSYSDTVTFTNTTNNGGNTTRGVALTVNPPGTLAVTPATSLTSSGLAGGPFSPSSQQFTLQNTGSTSINWTAAKIASWVSLDSASGTLAAGASTTVTATINGNADTLAVGSYDDTVTFTNTTNNLGNTTRAVALTVNAPGSLTVTAEGGFNSSGSYGGSFSPSSLQYTLSNPGTTSINWTAAKNAGWVSLGATSGTLAPGANTTVTVSINTNANSLNAGTYGDTVYFSNTTNGTGNTSRSVSLTVNPLPASVTLGSLSQTYDGSAKPVTVTTTPAGLANSVTYDGSSTEPTAAGTYAVVATVTDPNYTGSATGSLVIGKASQTITFAQLGTVLDNAVPFALAATASSGLTVSYSSSNTNVATVSGTTVTIVGLGTTTITASQTGDANYNAATSVPQTLTVGRANPLAVTSGPYSVLISQSVSLNGSASQPSYNETISSYEWDLNNDNTFGDVTGANVDISYATLNTTWGRAPGPNTIQLKVTDSSGKTSITSTTLTLIATLTWDANTGIVGAQDGAGAWVTTNQWWTGSANASWSSSANAIFGNSGTGGVVTLASPTTVSSITFNTFTGTYTLGTANQAITLNGGITNNSTAGIVSIISPVALGGAQNWSNSSSGTITVSGAISGSGGFTKSGTGTVILNPTGTSDYAGTTIISTGVLNIQKATALGSVADGTSVSSGAALQIQGDITVGAETLNLNGLGISNTGALRNISGTNIYGGLVSLNGATRINSDSGTLTLSNTGTITGAGLALTVGGAGNVTINSIIGTATGSLTKDGAGTLILGNANTFSGGFNINGGVIQYDSATPANVWGDAANVITFTGSGTLHNNNNAYTLARSIAVNSGVTATLSGAFGESTDITGAVTDAGGVNISAGSNGWAVTMSNAANTLSGTIWVASSSSGNTTLTANSMADGADSTKRLKLGAGAVTADFTLQGSTVTPVVWTNRAVELAGTTGAISINNNSTNAARTLTISPNLLFTTPGSGNKTLTLGGSNAGNNIFGGNIGNNGASTTAIAKTGAGTWSISGNMSNTGGVSISGGTLRLSGTNTYSGNTNFAANGVILTVAGSQAASANTTFVMNTNASSAASTLRLLDDGSGTIAFATPVTSSVNNSPGNTHTFFVGNNSTANGGTSSGTTTGSTLSLPSLTVGTMNTTSNIGSYDITGANGYRLQINSVVLNNANFQGVGVNSTTTFNPTSANLTLGTVTMAAGNALKGIPFLVLGGTSTDNRITGAISNATDALTTGRPLNLTKSNTVGVWTLSGPNTYTGTTTISGGLLEIGGSGTLGSGTYNGAISIASTNSGTFKYNSSANQALGGDITGAGALVKDGAGILTITGTNSYAGITTVSGGKLFINGSLSNTAVALNVDSGATLGGTGTIGRNVTIAAGGKLEFNLSTAAASHDRLDISTGRSFAFSGASVLTITSTSGASPGIYTLITGGNNITGVPPATVNLPAGWVATVSISGNSLLLNVTSASGPVDHFDISTIASPQTVGTPITGITLTAKDSSNNTATGFTGTVTFGGTAGITGTSAAFTAGVLTGVSITPTVVGSNLTFTVNDGAGHAGSAAFTVLSLYDAWAAGTFQNPFTDTAAGSDPDGDQLTNLQEYAFGTDPTASSGGSITYVLGGNVTNPGQPDAANLAVGQGVDYRAIFGRRKNYLTAGLTYTVEFSADLQNWVPSAVTPTVLTNTTGGIDAVSVPYPFFIPVQGGFVKPTYFKVGVRSN